MKQKHINIEITDDVSRACKALECFTFGKFTQNLFEFLGYIQCKSNTDAVTCNALAAIAVGDFARAAREIGRLEK